ncbi:hypothetical protein C8A01DRAFT_48561 [Parachaetomium inaequale]|uniref:Apple domain-containing protein n=1 Tax=Parachaetomium inaequale TaxID=2588326 RepID=A0AAN6SPF4_9PEZI|nr:hypothetical protein C8A01DRAFT_48561 [Parachaetomium inaequale]
MKSLLLAALALAGSASAYPRFQKYEECVSYCDNDPTCQSAFFDTISGDCQYHACIQGQTPPDRFKGYIKSGATEYCPGTSPTASSTAATRTPTAATTSTSGLASSATETSGALARWAVLGGEGVPAAAAVWVVMGVLG